jgi:hypothetical protein
VADLVDRDRLQVEIAVNLPRLRRVEEDVAGIGAAIERRRREGEGELAGRLCEAADSDVAEPQVALLVARGPDRRAAVGD